MAVKPRSALDLLVPAPREITHRGALFALDPTRILSGTGERSQAWQALKEPLLRLPSEGYFLQLADAPSGPQALIAAADEAGERHARTTIAALLELGDGLVPACRILDWPELPLRGTIEGFYGEPWSHSDRLDHLRFSAACKLNSYFYAPKDDPYHRERWREPYPDADLHRLQELATAADRHGLRFVYCLAPGLSIRYSSSEDHSALLAKADQLWRIGIGEFALLFDDVPTELEHPDDAAVFGSAPGSAGAAQGLLCARFQADFLAPRGVTTPLLVAPIDYAGMSGSPYRDRLAGTLPADAQVFWTGPDIVVGRITGDEALAAAGSYGRDIVLWDNYPVNDFDPARLFLGPLQGRGAGLAHATRGIVANPMVEAAPSRFALATTADWAWNPAGYDERDSAERALLLVAGASAEDWRPLVAALSSWPPSASDDAALQSLADRTLAGEDAARHELHARLSALATAAGALTNDATDLARQSRPWILAAEAGARAALAALDLQDGAGGSVAHVEELLREADSHTAKVLRGILPPFVRAVVSTVSASAGHRRSTAPRSPAN